MLHHVHPFSGEVLDEIEAAVDTAEREGRGVLLLLSGAGPTPPLADTLGRLSPAELLAGGFDVAGARGAYVSDGERVEDPDVLIAGLRDRLGSGRTLVLALEDVDLGLPTLNWSDYFLLRALPPLLAAHPLVVVATATSAGVHPAIVAELEELGVARTIEAEPERIDEQAGDDARAQLQRAFAPLGEGPAAKGYDVAVRTLRLAALEGTVFTVGALARVLGEDEDALSDLLDDHLVFDDEHPDAPLDGLGFVDVPGGSAYRYGFRSARFWSVIHPVHGSEAWPMAAPVRRFARKYAEALASVYGPDSPEALFRIWELSRLAGDDQGQPFAWRANAFGDVGDRVRLLAAEAAAHEGPRATRDPQAMLAGTRRIVQLAEVAAPTLERDDLLRYAKLARSLLTAAEHALPPEAHPRAWSDVYQLFGVAALQHGWRGDVARCEAERLALVDPADPLGTAHQTTMLVEALLPLLTDEEWQVAAPTHLDLSVPWLDEYLRADLAPAKARARLTDRIAGLLNEATGTLAGLPAQERQHTEAHVLHARATITDERDRARDLEQRAFELLRDDVQDACGIRAAVLARLS
jgi:hypothetical protein